MSNACAQYHIDTPDQMVTFGQTLAKLLGPGQVIALYGDVGAGKSLLSRSIIQTLLGYPEDVPSPTFTIVQTYETDHFDIWHCDLYRLTDLSQVDELGLIEAFETSLVLVEWPELIADDLPSDHIAISIKADPKTDQRLLTLKGPIQLP